MVKSLWFSLQTYLILFSCHVKTAASKNLNDVVYTTPYNRLTISTPKPKSRIDKYLFTCMKVDKYTRNQIIYCGYSKITQLKADGSKRRINTMSGFEKTALQLDAHHWLLAVLDIDCILKVSFAKPRSQSEFAGCHGEGNDDGVGTSATFDQPRDMVYNKLTEGQVVVLTRTKLRLLDMNTARVSTYPLTLPEGFTKMIWYECSLILLSKFVYGKVSFTLSGEVSEIYLTQSDMINWVPLSALPSVALQTSYTHYITDVAPAGHPGVFLLSYKQGKLRILDMINNRTEVLYYNNSCLGEHSSFVHFNFRKSEMFIAYSGELCVATISWTDFTKTSVTTTLITSPQTNSTLTTLTPGYSTTSISTTESLLRLDYLSQIAIIFGGVAIISAMILTAYFILTISKKKRRRKKRTNSAKVRKKTDLITEIPITPMYPFCNGLIFNHMENTTPYIDYKIIESQQLLDLEPVFSPKFSLDVPTQPTQE